MIEHKKNYWAFKKKITAANKQIDTWVYEL